MNEELLLALPFRATKSNLPHYNSLISSGRPHHLQGPVQNENDRTISDCSWVNKDFKLVTAGHYSRCGILLSTRPWVTAKEARQEADSFLPQGKLLVLSPKDVVPPSHNMVLIDSSRSRLKFPCMLLMEMIHLLTPPCHVVLGATGPILGCCPGTE